MYPIVRYLGFGSSNSSTGFGQVSDYWVPGPLAIVGYMKVETSQIPIMIAYTPRKPDVP